MMMIMMMMRIFQQFDMDRRVISVRQTSISLTFKKTVFELYNIEDCSSKVNRCVLF